MGGDVLDPLGLVPDLAPVPERRAKLVARLQERRLVLRFGAHVPRILVRSARLVIGGSARIPRGFSLTRAGRASGCAGRCRRGRARAARPRGTRARTRARGPAATTGS